MSRASQQARARIHDMASVFRELPAQKKSLSLFKNAAALEARAKGKWTLRGRLSCQTGAGTQGLLAEAAKLYDAAAVNFLKSEAHWKAARSFERSSDILVNISKSNPVQTKFVDELYAAGRNYLNASACHKAVHSRTGDYLSSSEHKHDLDRARACFDQIGLSGSVFAEEVLFAEKFVHSMSALRD